MNYQAIYDQLVQKRLLNPATKEEYGYVEEHHILPSAEGGLNSKDNLVVFTAREHYIAHLLLAKIYNDVKMLWAYKMMSKCKSCKNQRKFKINSHLYEAFRKLANEKICGEGNGMFGRHHSEDTKAKMRAKALGKHHTEETRRKISKGNKGKHLSEQTRMKLSQSLKGRTGPNKGKHMSDDTKQKLSNATLKYHVLQYDLSGNFIKEWHSVKEISLTFNCTIAAIRMCCIGKSKTSLGYVWKYKDVSQS